MPQICCSGYAYRQRGLVIVGHRAQRPADAGFGEKYRQGGNQHRRHASGHQVKLGNR